VSGTWLSTEAHERLTRELSELKTVRRVEIAAEIETARAHGDLRENAEYHAAKDEQGRIEERIRRLEALLRDAEVGAPGSTDVVAPGLVVTLVVGGEVERYLIGSREELPGELTLLSPDSPMGRAVLGARAGETRGFTPPTGETVEVVVQGIAFA
jgi:transcription elongation factor GreA